MLNAERIQSVNVQLCLPAFGQKHVYLKTHESLYFLNKICVPIKRLIPYIFLKPQQKCFLFKETHQYIKNNA